MNAPLLVGVGFVALEGAAWVIGLIATKVFAQPIPRRAAFLATQTAQLARLANGEAVGHRLHKILGWDYGVTPRVQGQKQNAQGLRASAEYAPEPAPGVLRVAVFGDSQVYGGEVDDDGPFPRQLEVGWNADALNYGVGGYGADQVLLRFREDAAHLKPHVVIFVVTTVMAPRVVSRYRRFQNPEDGPWFKPRFVRDGNVLRFIPSPVATREDADRLLANPAAISTFATHDFWYNPALFEHRLYEWSAAYRLLSTSGFSLWKRCLHRDRIFRGHLLNADGEATQLLIHILSNFASEAQAMGMRPLVLFLPSPSEVTAVAAGDAPAYATVRTALDAAQVPTADVGMAIASSPSALSELFAPSGHYTARGNAVVAEALAEVLQLPRRVAPPLAGTALP